MSLCKCEETQISKQSCQLGMLIGEIFSTRTSFMRRDSNSWISQKKKKILSVHGSTNRSQLWSNNKTPTEYTTKNSPLLSSSNHILQIDAIQHPLLPVYRKNRKPLAKEINYCNSILCFRAHKGPHEYCQIILHGTVLYFSPIYTADIEEVPCLLHLSWDDTINFYLWGTWPT